MPDKCLTAAPTVIYGHAYRMQVVEWRLEQAAEDARSRPVKASIPLAVIPAQARLHGCRW